MRRAVVLLVLAALAVPLITSPPSSAADTCRTSGPASGAFTVTVCVGGDLDAAPLTGDVTVPITATAANGHVVKEVFASLSDAHLIYDYEAPWRFELPTGSFVDGGYTLQVRAVVDGSPDFTSWRTNVGVDFDNGVTEPPVNTRTFDRPKPGAGSVVLAAVGDGASGETGSDAVVDLISSWQPEVFLYLGDVYRDGTGTEFHNWYGSSGDRYGTFRSITAPTIGNHEYQNGSAGAPYFFYWDNVPHYYSFDAGPWHVISLDTNTEFAQLGTSSPQYRWLDQDLLDTDEDCVLAFFHHPRFSVGNYAPGYSSLQPIWSLLASNGVDLVLNGHDHNYQRWKPLGPGGFSNPAGTREIIVGTGGHDSYGFSDSDGRVEERFTNVDGALRLELRRDRALFSFQRTDGAELDGGSFACTPAIDRDPPSQVQDLSASPLDANHVDLSWEAATDNVGIAGYRIYRDGALLDTVGGTQLAYRDGSVQPATAYLYKVAAYDAAGNVGQRSDPAEATTPEVDRDAPSTPRNVDATVVDRFRIRVTWDASSDNVGVTRYRVYRDDVRIRSLGASSLAYVDRDVEPGGSYEYEIVAEDAAGNESNPGKDIATIPGFLFFDGFESGDLSEWTYRFGMDTERGDSSHGDWAAEAESAGTATFATESLPSGPTELHGQVAFKLRSRGENGVDLLRFRSSSGAGITTALVNSEGMLAAKDERSGVTFVSDVVVTEDVWHTLQLKAVIDGTTGRLAVWYDGVKVAALARTRNLGTSPIARVQIGDNRPPRVYDVLIDDVMVDPDFIT